MAVCADAKYISFEVLIGESNDTTRSCIRAYINQFYPPLSSVTTENISNENENTCIKSSNENEKSVRSIFAAILSGDSDYLRTLDSTELALCRDVEGNTSLHMAVFAGNVELVSIILFILSSDTSEEYSNAFENILWQNTNKQSALTWACLFQKNNAQIKQLFLKYLHPFANILAKIEYNSTFIFMYASGLSYMRDFISHDDFNIRNQKQEYPLQIASRYIKRKIFFHIFEHSSDVSIRRQSSITALEAAIYKNKPAIVRLLFTHPEIRPLVTSLPRMLVFGMANYFKMSICRKLIEISLLFIEHFGSDIIYDYVLHDAMKYCPQLLGTLLKYEHLNWNLLDDCRCTFLMYMDTSINSFIDDSNPNILRLVVNDARFNPNLQGREGNTLMHQLLLKNRKQSIDTLIAILGEDSRLKYDIKNEHGLTALEIAQSKDIDLRILPCKWTSS